MAKFNTATKTQKIENLAGGQAYTQSPELEFVSILLNSFVTDQFYRSASDTVARLRQILPSVDPEFAAKTGVYARRVFGMRSISHVLASELAPFLSKKSFARNFYTAVVKRPDDMTEIVAYHFGEREQTRLSDAMKAGFARAFDQFDGYHLGKYRGEGKGKKLVDVVNLVHPKGTERNATALKALIDGELRSTGTWEVALGNIGQTAGTDEAKAEGKAEAWGSLLKEKKLGYLALVRNLRNILKDAPDAVGLAIAELTDEVKIAKSLIMPFQLITAYKQLDGSDAQSRKVRDALDTAIELSCRNVPDLKNTLVVVDNSGSMTSPVATSKHIQMSEAGAAFGMILAKRSNADVMEFGTRARYIPYDLKESVLKFSAEFSGKNQVDHGTNFHAIFETAKKAYERIVIFSDMQGWIGYHTPDVAFKAYRAKHGATPFVYSVDLAGQGSMQFPESKVFALAGFSGEMFTVMERLETDREALVNTIKALDFETYLPQVKISIDKD